MSGPRSSEVAFHTIQSRICLPASRHHELDIGYPLSLPSRPEGILVVLNLGFVVEHENANDVEAGRSPLKLPLV